MINSNEIPRSARMFLTTQQMETVTQTIVKAKTINFNKPDARRRTINSLRCTKAITLN